MIKFNLHLEQLQLHLNSLQYLDSTFARFTSLELLMEIAHLDSESKGYLLHSDITPEELMTNTFFSSFLRREFPLPTIPFTMYFSFQLDWHLILKIEEGKKNKSQSPWNPIQKIYCSSSWRLNGSWKNWRKPSWKIFIRILWIINKSPFNLFPNTLIYTTYP